MRKQSLLWSLAAATAMFFTSCNNDNTPTVGNGESATVKISIVSSSVRASSGTEDALPTENKISSIEAYSFDATGKAIDYTLSEDVLNSATLAAETGNVTVVVVANAKIGEFGTLAELQDAVSSYELSHLNSTGVSAFGFVMSDSKALVLEEGVNTTTLSLKRTVSKFNAPTFTNTTFDFTKVEEAKIKEAFPTFDMESDDVSEIKFTYESYALANGLNKTMVLNVPYPNTVWSKDRGTWFADKGFEYMNSEFDVNGNYNTNGVYSGDFSEAGVVYVHENFPYADFTPEGSTITGYNPKEVYCFIIKGTLTWGTEKATRYWRVNLVKETGIAPNTTIDKYCIYRNGLYKVNIDAVKTVGYNTPQEAEEETPVIPVVGETLISITVSVEPWDVYVNNQQM